MNNSIQYGAQLLVYQIPILLVCLTGFILAIVFYRRSPKAAALTMGGVGLMVLTVVTVMAVQVFLMNQRTGGRSMSIQTFSSISYWVSLSGNILRAIATGLLLAAAFVGRRPAGEMGFPVSPAVPGRY